MGWRLPAMDEVTFFLSYFFNNYLFGAHLKILSIPFRE